jgi:hypothetical protein
MIASWKKDAPGHKIRHQIYDKYKLSPPEEIEFFGTITGTYINSKCEGLDKFNFSIAVENCIQDGYFSEKLLVRKGTSSAVEGATGKKDYRYLTYGQIKTVANDKSKEYESLIRKGVRNGRDDSYSGNSVQKTDPFKKFLID